MTDTVPEVFYWRLKSWAELAEEEDEYLEELQNKNKNKEVKQAGKQLSNFQRRLIDRIKNRKSYVEVGLQKVPSQITVDDIRSSFSSYGIRDCNFKRTNCFFLLPQEQAIRLVEEGKQRITIKGADILIVILPIRNEH